VKVIVREACCVCGNELGVEMMGEEDHACSE